MKSVMGRIDRMIMTCDDAMVKGFYAFITTMSLTRPGVQCTRNESFSLILTTNFTVLEKSNDHFLNLILFSI